MREYLFRGKMIANGKWSEGNLLVTKQGCCITTRCNRFRQLWCSRSRNSWAVHGYG